MARYSEAQNKATQRYQKENLEIVSFRVKKGKRAAYNELSKKKNQPLSQILENYLDNECNAAGINPTEYIIRKEGEKE